MLAVSDRPAACDAARARFPDREPALRFEDVVHRYGSHLALDGLGLEVARGETLALLGPNGAGKSTTISLLLGLLRPSSGTVEVLGTTPRRAVAEGRVGAMLQTGAGSGLPPGVQGGGGAPARAAPLPPPGPLRPYGAAGRHRRAPQPPDPPALGRPGPTGAFCRRHCRGPRAGLPRRADRSHGRGGQADVFWRMIRQFGEEGRTIVFATHHLQEADQFADRVAVINRGRVVADGPGATLKAAIAARRVRFVCDHADRRDFRQPGGGHRRRGARNRSEHGVARRRRDRDRPRASEDPLPGPRGRPGRDGRGVRRPHCGGHTAAPRSRLS